MQDRQQLAGWRENRRSSTSQRTYSSARDALARPDPVELARARTLRPAAGRRARHLRAGAARSCSLWTAAQREPAARCDRQLRRPGRRSTTPWTPPTAPTGRSTPHHHVLGLRTFQGWTALSDMDHTRDPAHGADPGGDGVPDAPAAAGRRGRATTLRRRQIGQSVRRCRSRSRCSWRPSAGHPRCRAGNSVWWHCNMVHGVAPVTGQQGWGRERHVHPGRAGFPATSGTPRSARRSAPLPARTTSQAEHYERT